MTILDKLPFRIAGFLLAFSVQFSLQAQLLEGGGMYQPDSKKLAKAEKLYQQYAYHEAIPVFENYLQDNPAVSAMFQLADCYRLTSDFIRAETWYAKGLAQGEADSKYRLCLAQMQQANEKYAEAAQSYGEYLKQVPEDKRAASQKQACEQYTQFLLTRVRYEVQNLDFNSPGYDFAPAWHNSGLYYSSSRDSAKAISWQHTWTGTQFFDLYFAEGEKTTFATPQRLKGDASTKYHEANASCTPDGKQVYFTRNNFMNGDVGYSADKVIKLKIYRSDADGLKWTNDQSFEFNNDAYSVGHPALSPDGSVLYFVSDMPGGYGATDLYMSVKDGDKWGAPQNLGPGVNTEGYEMFPYAAPDGELFFASDGHGGLGGLDIFRTNQDIKSKKWGKIRNVGAPINSAADDFGFTFGKDRSHGYFTSNRSGGHGLDDIYGFTDDGISLEGIVVDAKTGEPICSSRVLMAAKTVVPNNSLALTECDGQFEFSVLKNMDYCFEASAAGYEPKNDICASTKGVQPGTKVMVRIPLHKITQTALQVLVRDRKTKEPVPAAKISLTNSCDALTQDAVANAQGMSCFVVRCACDMMAVANASGYLPGSANGTTVGRCAEPHTCDGPGADTIIVELDKLPGTGDPYADMSSGYMELRDIYYDFDKWNIRPESETQLKVLLGFLIENEDAVVEIASHTDARAPSDYNIRLSQKRAQSVVDWLVANGIDRSRLKPKGYGETRPRNSCSDNVSCSEYEHQRNRRTEFRVISGKFDIKSLERVDMQVDPCKLCPF